jgi:integrase
MNDAIGSVSIDSRLPQPGFFLQRKESEMSNPTKTQANRAPWNNRRRIGPKPPLKLREIWAIRIRLQLAKRTRDLALFNLAIDSKLRGCDLVRLRVGDIAQNGCVVARATVVQRKSQQPVRFELTEQTRDSSEAWIAQAQLGSGEHLFSRRMRRASPE